MTLTIRSIAREDRAQWEPLWDGYNAFYGREGPTALDPHITDTTWARFFDPYEPMHAIAAEEEGKLIGVSHYLLHRSTTSIGPSLYVQDIFTAPEARGKGVATAMIEAIYRDAETMGAGRVYWQTHETNVTAQRLYDRLAERSGFIVYRHIIS